MHLAAEPHTQKDEPPMIKHTEAKKAIVQRLIDEVLNGGNLDLIDQLYTPELAPAARK
jgi:hypothetical protein